ncbi:hypothetical protein Q9966_008100 [Columba livia]|nr:hypothetical protein Q9966_008100 [Columba livia]
MLFLLCKARPFVKRTYHRQMDRQTSSWNDVEDSKIGSGDREKDRRKGPSERLSAAELQRSSQAALAEEA